MDFFVKASQMPKNDGNVPVTYFPDPQHITERRFPATGESPFCNALTTSELDARHIAPIPLQGQPDTCAIKQYQQRVDHHLEGKQAWSSDTTGDSVKEQIVYHEGESVSGTHQYEYAGKPAPAIWYRIVFRSQYGADGEHDKIAGEVTECCSPI